MSFEHGEYRDNVFSQDVNEAIVAEENFSYAISAQFRHDTPSERRSCSATGLVSQTFNPSSCGCRVVSGNELSNLQQVSSGTICPLQLYSFGHEWAESLIKMLG